MEVINSTTEITKSDVKQIDLKKPKNKCSVCNLKLTPGMKFICECDKTKQYCITHYPREGHECHLEVKKIEVIGCVKSKLAERV